MEGFLALGDLAVGRRWEDTDGEGIGCYWEMIGWDFGWGILHNLSSFLLENHIRVGNFCFVKIG